ncbi:MAG: hypothetical protein WC477_00860 [Patescibacteria group bacterium]
MVQDVPISDVSSGGVPNLSNFDFGSVLQNILFQMGQDPLHAMIWLFLHGGWVIFLFLGWFAFRALWLDSVQLKAQKKKRFIVLAIDVPRESLQTVKAVDNLFAHLAGAHSPIGLKEKWIDGKTQDPMSVEIISIEGHVQYLMHCNAGLRDLIEASVYAQYPDAEITEVEDYATKVPQHYPDDTYDCFGTELIPVKSDVYPIKNYEHFEDKMTGEFKDPLAALLEAFSRLGPGEQAWYQIIITPIDQKEFGKKSATEMVALKGERRPPKPTFADHVANAPMAVLGAAGNVIFGTGVSADTKKREENQMKMLMLTPGERGKMEAVEKKAAKIQYKCKIRFMYIGRKEVFQKGKILQSFIGAIKQFNTNDLQALKPEGNKVGVNGALLFMRDRRNNHRKNKLIRGYRSRSDWVGVALFHMGTDELAGLWHLPVVKDVKAPQLKKTEAKKIEPPINLPFG